MRSAQEIEAERAVNALIDAVVNDKKRQYYGTRQNVGAYVDQNVEDARQAVLALIFPPAVVAPAVGVTVEWLDARIAESEEKQRGQFWAAQLPEAGKVLAYREVRALLTAAPAHEGEE